MLRASKGRGSAIASLPSSGLRSARSLASVSSSLGWWDDSNNQKAFLEGAAKVLNIRELSDWYRVSKRDVIQLGGTELFKKFDTLPQMLQSIYPHHSWNPARFVSSNERVPKGFWKNKSNLLQALTRAEEQLGIQKIEDWYSVSLTDLKSVGFISNFTKTKLVHLLQEKYPDHEWNKVLLLRGRYAQQKRLERAVASLFPEAELNVNARREVKLKNPVTGALLELDVYLPSLHLAFEYQDIHHYKNADYAFTPLKTYQERDVIKQRVAAERGITLVLVPCWWDGRQESLVATIKRARPDLLTEIESDPSQAIPEHMPPGFASAQDRSVEGIGEPINACFLTQTSTDPTGWWLFEKYDGVRGLWNPEKKVFYSRYGKQFAMPQEVIDSMPSNIFLDGELWFGRDNFGEATKIARRAEQSSIDWSQFRYMVFDAPTHKGRYEERYNYLAEILANEKYKYVSIAPREVCQDGSHLEAFFQGIIREGGEGVILRNPDAPYESGRSRGFLKHKKFRDGEAMVTQCLSPTEWECKLPNGVVFRAGPGTGDFGRNSGMPNVGDIISFKHSGYLLGSKKPKTPTIYRVRKDMTWEDVVNNFKERIPSVNALPLRKSGRNKPLGHWHDISNVRQFFCTVAQEMDFDPFNPENWKRVTSKQIAAKGGRSILRKGLHRALKEAFPELQFRFKDGARSHWKKISRVRTFLDAYAKKKGLDPLDSNTWQSSIDFKELMKRKGGYEIEAMHGGLPRAIQKAYPELVFSAEWLQQPKASQETKRKAPNYWTDINNCRKFFDEVAKEKGLDPLDPATWSSIPSEEILGLRGGWRIQICHGGLKKALVKAYPEIKFNSDWYKEATPPGYWKNVENCRKFFDDYANESGFDPLDVKKWKSIRLEELQEKKGGWTIQERYGGWKKALAAVYPELNFDWKAPRRLSSL